MNSAVLGILSGISAVIVLAIVAVLVSKKSDTSNVIKGAATGLAAVIHEAVLPITAGDGGSGAESVTSIFGTSNSTGNLLYTSDN